VIIDAQPGLDQHPNLATSRWSRLAHAYHVCCWRFVNVFVSYPAHRQTDRQTKRQRAPIAQVGLGLVVVTRTMKPCATRRDAMMPRVPATQPAKLHVCTSNGCIAPSIIVLTRFADSAEHAKSEQGPGRAAAPPSHLLAVPNVTAHPSTASLPTAYHSMWHYNCICPLKD